MSSLSLSSTSSSSSSTKDVLSQIRDLQLAIEDFNSIRAEPSCLESCSEQCPHDKNEGFIDNTTQQQDGNRSTHVGEGEKTLLVYPLDEKTAIEEPPPPSIHHTGEKTLVEDEDIQQQQQESFMPLDKLNIQFSIGDFSTLVDQFSETYQEGQQCAVAAITSSEPVRAVVDEEEIQNKELIDEPRKENRGGEDYSNNNNNNNNYQQPPPSPLLPITDKAPPVAATTLTTGIDNITTLRKEASPVINSYTEVTGNDKYLVEEEKEELALSFPPSSQFPPPLIITTTDNTTASTTDIPNSTDTGTTTSPTFNYSAVNSPMALSAAYPDIQSLASPLIATPKSRSSISSRRSRRTLSKKSSRSSRYFPKQLKQEHQGQATDAKFHPRSYAEMMRVPNTRERIAFYERTFKQCLRADSKLSSWVKQAKEKGLPKAMTEGYTPPPRPISPEIQPAPTMSSSLSGSISTFLRKASVSNSVTLPRRAVFSGETPKPSLSRLFLPTSISRLSLTRSPRPKVTPFTDDIEFSQQYNSPCQQPKSARPPKRQSLKPPRPFIVDSTPLSLSTTTSTNTTSRWRGSIRMSASSRRTSTDSLPTVSSPLSATSSISSRLSHSALRKTSCDVMLPSNERPVIPIYQPLEPSPKASKTIHSALPPPRTTKPVERGSDAALNELCNVLPQLDRQVVQEYLNESGGDPMVAITLAMSQYKKIATTPSNKNNNSNSNSKNSNVKKQSSNVYKHRQRVKY